MSISARAFIILAVKTIQASIVVDIPTDGTKDDAELTDPMT